MKRKVLFILLFLLCLLLPGLTSFSQEVRQKEAPQNRLLIGGGVGAQFGDITLVDVSPVVGYKVTERFVPGVGFSYLYYKIKNYYGGDDYETSIFGWSLFSRYYIFKDLFAHGEYQQLYYDRYNFLTMEEVRVSVPAYLIGGGYRMWLGGSFSSTILVLFNLNDVYDYPYSNPIIRVGFQVGL